MTDAPSGPPQPRWFSATGVGHSQWYIERFRRMAAEGADLAGEARFLDALVEPGSRVLDAGCGPGRLGAELHRRGHTVVGVDVDPELVEAARADHPGPTWVQADLSTLDLAGAGVHEPFDAALCAGNVMPFLAPGTGASVLERLRAHVRPDGPIAIGFATDREYSLAEFDSEIATSGLLVEHRFATWVLRRWTDDASFAVTVLRVPAA